MIIYQPISTAPKNGTVIMGIGADESFPHAMEWVVFAPEDIEEYGPGRWEYTEYEFMALLPEPEFWFPIPIKPDVKK